ncbi:hypothetical protein N0V82_009770 [Gnomoniopsis sp. IMI 355080]|nr:hypothetical protein N0V82_009770 [Gnomoniopsis sp. IMI 355080]
MASAHLASLVATSPLRLAHTINTLSYLPNQVVWHQASIFPVHGTNSTPVFPIVRTNVTACSQIEYDEVSPARTSVVRDDCADLANQVKASPGFWELYKWSDDENGAFRPLVSNGTCEFAVKRRSTPSGFNNTTTATSDVAIIGNNDVFKILNDSVNDFAATADEPYVDAERNQGHMRCKWWFAVNTSMEFRIQMTGSQ